MWVQVPPPAPSQTPNLAALSFVDSRESPEYNVIVREIARLSGNGPVVLVTEAGTIGDRMVVSPGDAGYRTIR